MRGKRAGRAERTSHARRTLMHTHVRSHAAAAHRKRKSGRTLARAHRRAADTHTNARARADLGEEAVLDLLGDGQLEPIRELSLKDLAVLNKRVHVWRRLDTWELGGEGTK